MEEIIETAEVSQDIQPQETTPVQEVPKVETPELDYKTDKRFGNMWKNENDIYKSYRELEKKFPETQKQLKQYQEAMKKYGLDDLTKFEESAKYYTDPQSELNQFLSYLSPVLSDEKRLNQFKDYVDKQVKDMEVEKFGSHLTDQERNALKEAQEVKKQFNELQEKQQVNEYKSQIDANMKDIEKFATDNKLEFDNNAFISECIQKRVPADLMMDFFKSRAMEHFVKSASRKAEENVMKNISKTKAGSIPAGDKSTAPGGNKTFQSKLENILGEAFK